MSTAKKQLSLTAAGRDFLTAELKGIGRSSPHFLKRRSNRVAFTFRPRKQGRDAIPDGPIPIDAFSLVALSYRWCVADRRGPCWRIALGIYNARFEGPEDSRIVFRCERAYDVTSPRPLLKPQLNATAIRSAVALHQAIEDADPVDLMPGPRLPAFCFGFAPRHPPRFDRADKPAARAGERVIDGLRAWPAELFLREGGAAGSARLEGSAVGLNPTLEERGPGLSRAHAPTFS